MRLTDHPSCGLFTKICVFCTRGRASPPSTVCQRTPPLSSLYPSDKYELPVPRLRTALQVQDRPAEPLLYAQIRGTDNVILETEGPPWWWWWWGSDPCFARLSYIRDLNIRYCLPCKATGVVGSMLGLVGLVSAHYDTLVGLILNLGLSVAPRTIFTANLFRRYTSTLLGR